MSADTRPPAGWQTDNAERLTFTEHDATYLSTPPVREGYRPTFIARHGVGKGAHTTWTYRREMIKVFTDGMFDTCLCGNEVHTGGFAPCDAQGYEIDATDEAGWHGLYVCNECERIIRADGTVIGKVASV